MPGDQDQAPPLKQYRVTILGAAAVGKSSLTSQFLSSDHMNTYDTVGKILLFFERELALLVALLVLSSKER